MDCHGDWGKWMVLKVARENTGMTLRELGEAVGGIDYAAVWPIRLADEATRQERRIESNL